MFGSGILEVAIGIIFIYVIVSLLCSTVREGVEAWTKTRAAYLEHGVRNLLSDRDGTGLAKSLFEHPLIDGLYSGRYVPRPAQQPGVLAAGNNLPSYIAPRSFALALLDVVARGPAQAATNGAAQAPVLSLAELRKAALVLENVAVRRLLLTAIDAAQGDLDTALRFIEGWYDGAMERVTGWYKRSTQWILFSVALLIAIAANIDTIAIARHLYHNEAARAVLVGQAGAAVADAQLLDSSFAQLNQQLQQIQLPLGWSLPPSWQAFALQVLGSIPGWLLTALAATLGAPFWFDVLQKVMLLRGTIKPKAAAAATAAVATEGGAVAAVVATTASRPPISAVVATAPRSHAEPDADDDACDSCAADSVEATPDDQLPAATGGVA